MANVAVRTFFMKTFVRLLRKPQAKVFVEKLEGFVLDVGGGGEGIICRAYGSGTVCVDMSRKEIEEAMSRGAVANWVLCDASALPIISGTFDAVTFFFSLMYVKTLERKRAVIAEAKRVLRPAGLLHLWDAIIREKPDLNAIFVEADLPDGERIFTGYGVRGKRDKEQNLELVNSLASDAGFKNVRTESHDDWFMASFH